MTAKVFAPAKINLTLHVTGQRDDGYHLLDSLVMFADVGDWIMVERADETSLTVTGPMAAGVPTDASNLVVKAASLMGVAARITLEKHLPAAAGIGGGSSDAAATIRALSTLYERPHPDISQLLSLGADLPVCMHSHLTRMKGIGEQLEPLSVTPDWHLILINPRVSVPTGPVFNALPAKDNPPMSEDFPDWTDKDTTASWLAKQRNDLETPARKLQPVINDALSQLRDSTGCLLARMSGSGATCFGMFSDAQSCDEALRQLRCDHPNWWIVSTRALNPAQT